MTVETIFAQALAKNTPAERAAYLVEVCGKDLRLRQRVEQLLLSHAAAGAFLETPAIQRAAGELADRNGADVTKNKAPATDEKAADLAFLVPSDQPKSLGRLGHYEVLEVIGNGGMGTVLRAFDQKLQRVVAIKVMAPQLATTSPPRKRFLREARAAAQIRHEHVVAIHAVEEQPIPYLVMEYVPGETLQQKLDREGPLETLEVLRLGQQIARGLAAAHAQGLIHRDIKPSNILLENTPEECAKITDFGLARAADDASVTQSGVIAGTPMYMSPEQTRGEAIDHRADLFSLGSVLYTMASGRPPFRATTSMATLKRVAEDAPRPIREIIPDIPAWLCEIIGKLLAKNPADRFQFAKGVADLLGQYQTHLEHPSSAALPPPAQLRMADGEPLKPKREVPAGAGMTQPKRRRLVLAAAVLLAVVAGLSLTEASGLTNLGGTVIRIFTPDGTLVIQTDDPGVKVTIEGDGGLVITGAGLEEIRLRPGNYKILADKDGKKLPLEKELVSITKGAREIVKVKIVIPAAALPVAPLPPAEKGAFVLLAGGKERKFDILAEAIDGSRDGDIIEIRGNGPFVLNAIVIDKALVLRAGAGFQPRLHGSLEATAAGYTLISTTASMVMEGLEIQLRVSERDKGASGIMLKAQHHPLFLANCRMAASGRTATVHAAESANVMVYNCLLFREEAVDTRSCLSWLMPSNGRLGLVNSVLTDNFTFQVNTQKIQDISIDVSQSTLLCSACPLALNFKNLDTVPEKERCIQVRLTNTILDGRRADVVIKQLFVPPLPPEKGQTLIPSLIQWQESNAVHRAYQLYTDLNGKPLRGYSSVSTLVGWNKLWGLPNSDTVIGSPKYVADDVLSKLKTHVEKMTAQDFRLRPDSPGFKAGKDGKDLGADVDLVGPGNAYAAWKKTPDYQKWLKDTGQKK